LTVNPIIETLNNILVLQNIYNQQTYRRIRNILTSLYCIFSDIQANIQNYVAMFKLLCVYFLVHIQLTKSDSIYQTRNCSTTLTPLLNIISAQGRIVQPIAEEEQMLVEHVMPSLDITPCDLIHFREDIEEDHHHFETETDKHLKNPNLQ